MSDDTPIQDPAEKPGALVRADQRALSRPKHRVLVYPRQTDIRPKPSVVRSIRAWEMFWRARRLIVVCVLVSTLAAAAIAFLVRPVYRSTSLVSIGHAVEIALPGFETAAVGANDNEYFTAQLELFSSATVIDEAIRSGATAQDPEFAALAAKLHFAPGAAVIDDNLTASIRDRFSLIAHRESRSAEIRFHSSNAVAAAAGANAIADAYLKLSAEELDKKLRATSQTLSERAFELANKVSGIREQLLLAGKQNPRFASRLKWQWSAARDAGAPAGAAVTTVERQQLAGKIARLRSATGESAIAEMSPGLAALRSELAAAEAELAKVQGQYSPDYPPMKAAIDKVASLWQRFETKRSADLAELQRKYNELVARESAASTPVRRAQASLMGNSFAAQYNLLLEDQDRAQARYEELQNALGYLSVLSRLPINEARIVDRAKPASRSSGLQRWQILAAGMIAGLLAGLATTWVTASAAEKLLGPDDVEWATGLGTVGVIPRFERLREAAAATTLAEEQKRNRSAIPGTVSLSCDPQAIAESQIDEAFNRLRTSIFSSSQLPPRVLLVTSAHAGEGKTTVAIKTAMSMARASLRVALVDCDLRRPAVHTVLGLAGRTGVATFLATPMDEVWPLVNECRVGGTSVLHVIPAGDPIAGACDLIASHRLLEFIATLRAAYDFVVIDAPPLSGMSDALVISAVADGTLLVAQGEKTSAEDLRRICLELEQVNASVFGVVLSQVDVLASKYYQAYYPIDPARAPKTA